MEKSKNSNSKSSSGSRKSVSSVESLGGNLQSNNRAGQQLKKNKTSMDILNVKPQKSDSQLTPSKKLKVPEKKLSGWQSKRLPVQKMKTSTQILNFNQYEAVSRVGISGEGQSKIEEQQSIGRLSQLPSSILTSEKLHAPVIRRLPSKKMSSRMALQKMAAKIFTKEASKFGISASNQVSNNQISSGQENIGQDAGDQNYGLQGLQKALNDIASKNSVSQSEEDSDDDIESSVTDFKRTELGRELEKMHKRLDTMEATIEVANLHKDRTENFEYENQVRDIVRNMMLPTTKRVMEDREVVNSIHKDFFTLLKEIETMREDVKGLLISRGDEFKQSILDELDKKYVALKIEMEEKVKIVIAQSQIGEERLHSLIQLTKDNKQHLQALEHTVEMHRDESKRDKKQSLDTVAKGQTWHQELYAKMMHSIKKVNDERDKMIKRIEADEVKLTKLNTAVGANESQQGKIEQIAERAVSRVEELQSDEIFNFSKGKLRELQTDQQQFQTMLYGYFTTMQESLKEVIEKQKEDKKFGDKRMLEVEKFVSKMNSKKKRRTGGAPEVSDSQSSNSKFSSRFGTGLRKKVMGGKSKLGGSRAGGSRMDGQSSAMRSESSDSGMPGGGSAGIDKLNMQIQKEIEERERQKAVVEADQSSKVSTDNQQQFNIEEEEDDSNSQQTSINLKGGAATPGLKGNNQAAPITNADEKVQPAIQTSLTSPLEEDQANTLSQINGSVNSIEGGGVPDNNENINVKALDQSKSKDGDEQTSQRLSSSNNADQSQKQLSSRSPIPPSSKPSPFMSKEGIQRVNSPEKMINIQMTDIASLVSSGAKSPTILASNDKTSLISIEKPNDIIQKPSLLPKSQFKPPTRGTSSDNIQSKIANPLNELQSKNFESSQQKGVQQVAAQKYSSPQKITELPLPMKEQFVDPNAIKEEEEDNAVSSLSLSGRQNTNTDQEMSQADEESAESDEYLIQEEIEDLINIRLNERLGENKDEQIEKIEERVSKLEEKLSAEFEQKMNTKVDEVRSELGSIVERIELLQVHFIKSRRQQNLLLAEKGRITENLENALKKIDAEVEENIKSGAYERLKIEPPEPAQFKLSPKSLSNTNKNTNKQTDYDGESLGNLIEKHMDELDQIQASKRHSIKHVSMLKQMFKQTDFEQDIKQKAEKIATELRFLDESGKAQKDILSDSLNIQIPFHSKSRRRRTTTKTSKSQIFRLDPGEGSPPGTTTSHNTQVVDKTPFGTLRLETVREGTEMQANHNDSSQQSTTRQQMQQNSKSDQNRNVGGLRQQRRLSTLKIDRLDSDDIKIESHPLSTRHNPLSTILSPRDTQQQTTTLRRDFVNTNNSAATATASQTSSTKLNLQTIMSDREGMVRIQSGRRRQLPGDIATSKQNHVGSAIQQLKKNLIESSMPTLINDSAVNIINTSATGSGSISGPNYNQNATNLTNGRYHRQINHNQHLHNQQRMTTQHMMSTSASFHQNINDERKKQKGQLVHPRSARGGRTLLVKTSRQTLSSTNSNPFTTLSGGENRQNALEGNDREEEIEDGRVPDPIITTSREIIRRDREGEIDSGAKMQQNQQSSEQMTQDQTQRGSMPQLKSGIEYSLNRSSGLMSSKKQEIKKSSARTLPKRKVPGKSS